MANGTEVASIPGLQELGNMLDFGSNLQRLQALFGASNQQPSSNTQPASTAQTGSASSAQTGISASEAQSQADKATATKPTPPPQGLASPMLDQHEFGHWNDGAFCGLATMVMMMQANGLERGTSHADLEHYASRIYNKDAGGTSGAAMATYLRNEGMDQSSFTTTGNANRLVKSLQSGQPVPLGVVKMKGEITRLKGGSSERYPYLKVGDRHEKRFGNSGHWVLVTRFEGKAESPTAYYVNDPDVGGELKCTPAEISEIAAGEGNYWMVEQR